MPLYEYHCPDCEANIELLVGYDEKPRCPECGKKRLQRQLSTFAAAKAESSSLPVCEPNPGGCGLPGCGPGGCGMG